MGGVDNNTNQAVMFERYSCHVIAYEYEGNKEATSGTQILTKLPSKIRAKKARTCNAAKHGQHLMTAQQLMVYLAKTYDTPSPLSNSQ